MKLTEYNDPASNHTVYTVSVSAQEIASLTQNQLFTVLNYMDSPALVHKLMGLVALAQALDPHRIPCGHVPTDFTYTCAICGETVFPDE